MKPGIDQGEPVWEAHVELPARHGHYYLDTFGVWVGEPVTHSGGDGS